MAASRAPHLCQVSGIYSGPSVGRQGNTVVPREGSFPVLWLPDGQFPCGLAARWAVSLCFGCPMGSVPVLWLPDRQCPCALAARWAMALRANAAYLTHVLLVLLCSATTIAEQTYDLQMRGQAAVLRLRCVGLSGESGVVASPVCYLHLKGSSRAANLLLRLWNPQCG